MKVIFIILFFSNSSFSNTIGEQKEIDKIDISLEKSEQYLLSVDNQINFIDNNQKTMDNYEIKIIIPTITNNLNQ